MLWQYDYVDLNGGDKAQFLKRPIYISKQMASRLAQALVPSFNVVASEAECVRLRGEFEDLMNTDKRNYWLWFHNRNNMDDAVIAIQSSKLRNHQELATARHPFVPL